MVKERNIVICVILSFLTCGIYSLIWFVELTNDASRVDNDLSLSGGKALFFTIITCGIYGIYWNYKMGKTIFDAGCKKNIVLSDNSIVYLILSIFGLGIVNYCLMQNDLNKFASK